MSSVVIPNMLVAEDAGKGVQPPGNPLTMATNATALQGQMLSNQQQQNAIANFRAQQAVGRDFQSAIGPDGKVDEQKFGQIMSKDPEAALQAIQSSQATLNNISTQLANKGTNLNQALQRLKWTADSTGQLLTTGQPITRKQVINTLADSINDGINTPSEAASIAAGVPSDPQEIKGWLQNHYTASQQNLNGIIQHLQIANTGNKLLSINTNPLANNPMLPGQQVPMGLSPEAATSPVTYPGSQGQPVTTTRAAIAAGGNALPTGTPQTPGTPVVSGLTPEQSAAQNTYGGKAGGMGAEVVANASNLAQQRANLEGVLDEINSANPGPLADIFAKIGGVAGQLGIANLTSTSATQLMNKGGAQLVVSQVSSGLGVPTDGKMDEVLKSVPNSSMTPLAAQGAGAQIKGILDYKQAQAQAWTQFEQTNGPASYPQFQAKWNTDYPTAAIFQFQGLPKILQGRYWTSLSQADKTKFAQSFKKAEAAGYVQPMTNANK